ncbi:MAG: RNA polymerase sigma factor [Candidatus Firestonebacteria bacterium]
MEEKEIIQKILKGDKEAFAELFFKYEKFVFNIIRRIVETEQDVEDIAQGVFLKLYTNLFQFQGRSKFSTWLYRIVYNITLNFVQRKKDKFATENIDNIFEIQDTTDLIDEQEITKIYVNKLLELLPPNYRTVLELYYFKDLSYEEIAVALNIPINTVKTHISRAKNIIRKKLDK